MLLTCKGTTERHMKINPQLIGRLIEILKKTGRFIATMNTIVVLSLLYICIISPLGIFKRLLAMSPQRSKYEMSSL